MEKLVRGYESEGTKVVGWLCGQPVWGNSAVAVAWMGNLPASLYVGSVFDNSCAVLLPKSNSHMAAIWCYLSSPEYSSAVRKVNQKTQVATRTLA